MTFHFFVCRFLPVVQEEDVQVAAGAELLASVPADGENCETVTLVDELSQPRVSEPE